MGLMLTHGFLNMGTPVGLLNYTTSTVVLQRSGSHFFYRDIEEMNSHLCNTIHGGALMYRDVRTYLINPFSYYIFL